LLQLDDEMLRPLCVTLFVAIVSNGCSQDPKVAKDRYVQSGEKYAAAGKLAEATLEYRNAVQADPRDGDLRLRLADLYAKINQDRQAAEEYIRAADLLGERGDVQIRAGGILLLLGRFDDAKVRAEKALTLDAANVDAQILLANALAGLKDLKAAVDELEEAIKLAPDRSSTYTNLGVIEVTRGRRDAAEQAFKRAIELDERSAAGRLALGTFYRSIGQQQDGEKELRKALELEPDNVLVLKSLASLTATTDRLDEAESFLKRIVDVTKSPDASIALADFYIASSKETAARGVLEPLSVGSEGTSAAKVRLAALDHVAGHKDDAYRKLDELIAAEQDNLQALLVKTSMLLSDGRRDEALAPAERAVKSYPNSAPAHFIFGRVQAARNNRDAAAAAFTETLRINPRASGAQIALSRLHLAAGRTNASVGFAKEALSANPSSAEARLTLVRALIATRDFRQADAELSKLLAQHPGVAAVRAQKGILLALQRDPRARAEFELALKSDPRSVEALGGLIALDLQSRQPAAAISRIRDLAGSPSASSALLMLAARTYAATGDLQNAERFLRRIIDKDPSYLQAYSALGQLYLRQNRADAALAEFDAMAKRDPKPVAPLTLAAIVLQSQGKTGEAKAKLERVIQIDASAPVAANNLAWILAESGGNLEVAQELAQTAQRGLPQSPEVMNTLGYIYLKRGLISLAVPALQASVEKDASNALYHYHLGQALAKTGDVQAARAALERALKLDSGFTGADEARSLLESLRRSE
jgi:tetratricopeptide (TPR) repeat protein